MTLIAVDGPTGVGKSTTARALAAALDAELVLDPVSVSPLLDDYYTGEATPAAALDAELAFLRSRVDLLRPPGNADEIVVSDFTVMRTAPFAEFLEDPADREVVLDEMHHALAAGPRPDVLVLLVGVPEALLHRVRTRDRQAEVDLTVDHLQALTAHFERWRPQLLAQSDTSIVIDTEAWDPRRSDDLGDLVQRLRREIERQKSTD